MIYYDSVLTYSSTMFIRFRIHLKFCPNEILASLVSDVFLNIYIYIAYSMFTCTWYSNVRLHSVYPQSNLKLHWIWWWVSVGECLSCVRWLVVAIIRHSDWLLTKPSAARRHIDSEHCLRIQLFNIYYPYGRFPYKLLK